MNRHTTKAVFLIAVLFLAGCSATSRLRSSLGKKFRYTYLLTSPAPAGKLSYSDDRIKIIFRIDGGAIRYKLTNLTSALVTVDWQSATIGVRGRSHPIRSVHSYYAQEIHAAPTVILPKGYVIEMAIPASSVYHDGSKWQERDLLPTTDKNSENMRNRILANKGSIVEFLLPMRFEGSGVVNYTFRFKVSAVEEIAWEQYRKPWRPVPPKPNSGKFTASDQIMTGVIVAGVVGIAAVLLSQKKTPPTE